MRCPRLVSTTHIGHPIKFSEFEDGPMQLVCIDHNKAKMPFKVTALAGYFKCANINA